MTLDEASGTLVIGGRSYPLDGIDRVLVVGGGKAAAAMTLGVCDVVGRLVAKGIIVVKDGHRGALNDPRITVREASHPLPDARGVAATREIARLLEDTTPRDLVVVVLSGGASALLELLPEDVPLDDLRTLTDSLLRSGATIDEMNVVRKHVSRVKGGQLAAWAAPAHVVGLVLSDVVGAPLDAIASGPTVADPSTFADAIAILRRRHLLDRAPKAIVRRLERGATGEIGETPKPNGPGASRVDNLVVADIARACEAAREHATALGYHAALMTTFLTGEAREVAGVVCAVAFEVEAHDRPSARPAAILFGGETTVTVRGQGKGGRNQELALAAARAVAGRSRMLVASFATDGSDGPTDAAGAIVDGGTVARAANSGMDPSAHLDDNDAYPFLSEAGALLVTGPTGTNVCDARPRAGVVSDRNARLEGGLHGCPVTRACAWASI